MIVYKFLHTVFWVIATSAVFSIGMYKTAHAAVLVNSW